MRTREVIKRVQQFTDYYGFDIPQAPGLKTKQECKAALVYHKRWLEEALTDALTGVDLFIRELGLEWVDEEEASPNGEPLSSPTKVGVSSGETI